MKPKAAAQSPGHITGFFRIYKNGSTGAGINVENGMKTKVQTAEKNEYYLNGKKTKLIVSEKVAEKFRKKSGKKFKAKIIHSTKYPIGFGLGISGSGALSLAIALNKLSETKYSKREITEIAKMAEIECGTGLGDVIAENYAGLIIGEKPFPSQIAEEIKCTEKFIVFGFFKAIATKKIIRSKEWKKKINAIGAECMNEFEKEKTMQKFIQLSRKFSLETGLATKQIRKVMEKMPKASMSMLGETIFIPALKIEKAKKIEKELKKYCKKTIIAKIALHGAR